jgi:hypothetical protein
VKELVFPRRGGKVQVEVVNSWRAINLLKCPAFYSKNRCFGVSAFYMQFLAFWV